MARQDQEHGWLTSATDDDATRMRNVPADTRPRGTRVPDSDPGGQGRAISRPASAPTPPASQRSRATPPTEQQAVRPTAQRRTDPSRARPSALRPRTSASPASARRPPSGGEDDEYRWHTERTARSETAEKDAVEFIDVKKSFGRNTILNGLNLGIPDDQISMILGPSGTGKSVCIKHMVGLLYPDEGDVLVHGESVPNMADDELFEMRKKFGVLFQDGALFGSMNLLRQRRVPAPPAHGQERGRDRRHRQPAA